MASNMYIKFESPSIAAESSDPSHAGEIEVLSWNHGIRSGENNLTFLKYLDGASTELMKFCWAARPIGKATLRCYRDDGDGKPVEYLTVVMQKILISNYSVSGGPGDIPTENVSLEFGTISYEYKGSKLKGAQPVTATYEVETRTVR